MVVFAGSDELGRGSDVASHDISGSPTRRGVSSDRTKVHIFFLLLPYTGMGPVRALKVQSKLVRLGGCALLKQLI